MSRLLGQHYREVKARLKEKSLPEAEALEIFELALGYSRLKLIQEEKSILEPHLSEKVEALLERRLRGEPLAYIRGSVDFLGWEFQVGPGVLIPRPETEALVLKIKDSLPGQGLDLRLLDLGTGSGVIAIGLKAMHPFLAVEAWDQSEQALDYARRNAQLHQVSIDFKHQDMTCDKPLQLFDIVVSNPPYVAANDKDLCPMVEAYEPKEALFGGGDGLDFYRSLAQRGRYFLKPGGKLFLEIGWEQGKMVGKLLEDAGWRRITISQDLAGKDRIVEAVWT